MSDLKELVAFERKKFAKEEKDDGLVLKAIRSANGYANKYNKLMKKLLAEHGDKGPWVSGVGKPYFPTGDKDKLRDLNKKFTEAQDKVRAEFKKLWPRTKFHSSKKAEGYRKMMVKAGGYGTGEKKASVEKERLIKVAKMLLGAKKDLKVSVALLDRKSLETGKAKIIAADLTLGEFTALAKKKGFNSKRKDTTLAGYYYANSKGDALVTFPPNNEKGSVVQT